MWKEAQHMDIEITKQCTRCSEGLGPFLRNRSILHDYCVLFRCYKSPIFVAFVRLLCAVYLLFAPYASTATICNVYPILPFLPFSILPLLSFSSLHCGCSSRRGSAHMQARSGLSSALVCRSINFIDMCNIKLCVTNEMK